MFGRDDEEHISYLDEYLIRHQSIQKDNELKEYILGRFLDICIGAGVDVISFEPEKGIDGDIVSVTIRKRFIVQKLS